MKVVVSTYYFSIFVQYNTFTDKVKPIHSCNIMHFTIASEKARQNRKIRMELKKKKNLGSTQFIKKRIPNQTNILINTLITTLILIWLNQLKKVCFIHNMKRPYYLHTKLT